LGKAERGILPALDGSFRFLLCVERTQRIFFYSAFHAYSDAQDSIYLVYNLNLVYVSVATSYMFFFIGVFFGQPI
jgi:hypothetical protein